jgi:hypothetical protein
VTNLNPVFPFSCAVLVLGGVKNMQRVMLWSVRFYEPLIVFDWWKRQMEQSCSLL